MIDAGSWKTLVVTSSSRLEECEVTSVVSILDEVTSEYNPEDDIEWSTDVDTSLVIAEVY